MFIEVPYEYLNGKKVPLSCTEQLTINLNDYQLCGQKFFELRITEVSNVENKIITFFQYNNNIYGTYSITTDQLISLLNTAFICPPEVGCANQNTSFDWELTPIIYDKWVSSNIVNEVQVVQPNLTYTITDLTIDGITYGSIPYNIWVDTPTNNASSKTADYIDAIIDYIASFNIPSYKGAINKARNGMTSNDYGDNLLELYFTTGTVVSIDIDEITLPLAGTFTFSTDITGLLELSVTDTSTIDTGDILEKTTFQVTDGIVVTGSTQFQTATITVYSIFVNNLLDTSRGWVITDTIATENGCATNNLATAVIQSSDIIDSIDNQVTKSGSSVN